MLQWVAWFGLVGLIQFFCVTLAILELTHSVDQTGLEQRDLSPSVS